MDRESGECVVRQVVEGLFGFDRLPVPPLDQDGLSILQLARGLARRPSRLSVLTAVDSTWKGTRLRTVGNERIRWAGREVEAVQVEALGHYKGPAGLSGLVRTLDLARRPSHSLPGRGQARAGLDRARAARVTAVLAGPVTRIGGERPLFEPPKGSRAS